MDKQKWDQNWQDMSQGMFEGLDWNGVFVAGGSVLACLDSEYPNVVKGNDIDLFLYAQDEQQARYDNNDNSFSSSYEMNVEALGLTMIFQTVSHLCNVRLFPFFPFKREKLRHVFETIQRNTNGKGDIIRTKNAITIINCYPFRHVQIILR